MMKRLLCLTVLGVSAVTGAAYAGDQPWQRGTAMANELSRPTDSPRLTLDLTQSGSDEKAMAEMAGRNSEAGTSAPVLTLSDGGGPALHGFVDLRVSHAYITPRGLVVENAGVVVQPLAGLVFDIYKGDGAIQSANIVAGVWSSLHSNHPNGDIWNECDLFLGVNVNFWEKLTFSATGMAWFFPEVGQTTESNPSPEYNMEFKLAYDDSALLKEYALKPYISLFWNFSGDSPVVLGERTFYIELGVSPSMTFKASEDYPITVTFPTYFQFGDSSFWGTDPVSGDRSNIGLFSTGIKLSMPLKFIPKEYGSWNAYAGFTYIHTCNPALTRASEIIGGGDSRDKFLGYMGVGFGF